MAVTTSNDKLFMAGGRSGDIFYSDIDIHNNKTESWSKENLSIPRSHCAAVEANDYILFAGGYLGTNTYSDKIDIYNTVTGTWSSAVLSRTASRNIGTI